MKEVCRTFAWQRPAPREAACAALGFSELESAHGYPVAQHVLYARFCGIRRGACIVSLVEADTTSSGPDDAGAMLR